MTIKEMKETLENVDKDHGWRLDHSDGYSGREFWFRDFEKATVIAEREEGYIPGFGSRPASKAKHTTHYYFFRDGDSTEDKPLSYFRQTKTSVLNLLKEARAK